MGFGMGGLVVIEIVFGDVFYFEIKVWGYYRCGGVVLV